jgi:L-threonylcarbamoyladenylate synthase
VVTTITSKQNKEMGNRYEKEDLQEALRVLREGGVILYPTDTIWGIGCDATNEEAVARVYEIKKRVDSKAMLVLLDGAGKLQGYMDKVPDTAWMLLEANEGERPMTIIYPGAKNLAKNLLAEDGSVGIRITEELFSKALCEQLRRPIVSTSANLSGEPAAKSFSEIDCALLEAVDYVCQYRRNDTTPKAASSIIKIDEKERITIIRK